LRSQLQRELVKVQELALQWAKPVFVAPTFCVAAVVEVALSLFIVTMASQNVPGLATIRACGYNVLGGFHAAAL
jgi:benzoate membrane transport protein